MANGTIDLARYVPPGVYIEEDVTRAIPAFSNLPRQLAVVGEGDHCKTIVNESILRGYVDEEPVEPDETERVFFPLLPSDGKKSTMVLFQNEDPLVPQSFSSAFLAPSAPVTAALASPVAPGNVNNGGHRYYVTFVVNGIESRPSTFSSTVTVVDLSTNGQIEIEDIPLLAGAPAGTQRKLYRTKASAPTGTAFLLTTLADNTTDTFTDNVADGSLTTALASQASGLLVITIGENFFDAANNYSFSYQSLITENPTDPLVGDLSDPLCALILRVGSFPGTRDFVEGEDYELNTGDNSIEWLDAAAASIASANDENYAGLVGKTVRLTVNGGVEQSHTFTMGEISTGTAEEVAIALNAAFSGLAIDETSVTNVVLITTATGPNASIQVGNGTANSILGFLNGQFDRGAGKTPAQGEEYFVTYESKRPDDEFNRPILSTTFDSFISKVGQIASDNGLSLAGQIAFEQSPPFIWHVQVKKSDEDLLVAADLDYIDGIRACELNADLTDIVVLSHPQSISGGAKPLVRSALRDHVIKMSSLLNKGERLGWFGMPVGTTPGDGETPNTFVFVATQELQVSADSPGRGRFVLNGPSFVRKTYRLPDTTIKQLRLDGTYLAVGVAALNASFLSPAEGLLRKEVVGFDEVELMTKGDRDYMASKGVNLVDRRAGRNIVFDPQTTDLSSAEFREINVMCQKDNIVRRVRKAVDDRIVGLVPDDLQQFVFEVKSVIATELTGAVADGSIASFQNDDGSPRNVSLRNDITVTQRQDDPTSYDFRFTFFVRFIAKRLFGLYTVSLPSGNSEG